MIEIIKNIKDKLIFNEKLEIRKSPLHGYGVFAKEDIKRGEILEECVPIFIKDDITSIDIEEVGNIMYYSFIWPKDDYVSQGLSNRSTDITKEDQKIVMLSGYGMMYNTANNIFDSNASWFNGNDVMVFVAINDIKKDEEICTYYELRDRTPMEHTKDELLYQDFMDKLDPYNFAKRTTPKLMKRSK